MGRGLWTLAVSLHVRRVVLGTALFTPLACGEPVPDEAADSGAVPEDAAAQQDAAIHDGIRELGALERIAGSGLITAAVNGWQPSFEGELATEVQLSRPHLAMSDAAGNIYVADKEAHAIRRIDAGGSLTTVAGVNEPGDDGDEPGAAVERHLDEPNGLYVLADGTLFILDLGNEKVRRVGADGVLTTVLSYPGLKEGRGLWVSAAQDEVVFCSGTQLMRWRDGEAPAVLADGFDELGNIASDGEGGFWVTDLGAAALQHVDATGRHTDVIAGDGRDENGALGADVSLPGVRAVWPDDRGGLFVGPGRSYAIYYLDAGGRLNGLLTHAETEAIRGITGTADGDLLIVGSDGGIIWRLPKLSGR
jgi:hypothetical protein